MTGGSSSQGGTLSVGGAMGNCLALGPADAGDNTEACTLANCTEVGTPLFSYSTTEEPDRFTLSCGNGRAPDIGILWTAPATGWYHEILLPSINQKILCVLV